MDKTIGFFDLETQNTFADINPDYPKLPSWEREKLRLELTPKLKLATSCVTIDGNKPEVFEEDNVLNLIDTLKGLDVIVGHNVTAFDYLVLSPYTKAKIVELLSPNTTDTFELLRKKTGSFVGLDDLAKLNLGVGKTLNSLEVPAMWRAGKKKEVREYCINDVKLLRDIFYFGKEKKRIKYTHKEYGEVKGVVEIDTPW